MVSLVVAPTALAQSPTSTSSEPPVEVRSQRRTVIDISEASIDCVVVGLSTTAVRSGRAPRFKSLIRLRPDFRKELVATSAGL
jgi:hypothetical protein